MTVDPQDISPLNRDAMQRNGDRETSEPLGPSIYGFIWKFSWRQQLLITAITVASFPFIYLSLYLPKLIVNDAISGSPPASGPFKTLMGVDLSQPHYLLTLCALLLVLYIINGGFLYLVNLLKNAMSERMVRRLRFTLFQRILRFPLAHFSKVSNSEMSAMIVSEVDQIREFMSDAIAMPVFQGGTFSVILFFMFMQDWVLGLAAIALIPLQAWITPKFQRRINELGRQRVQHARKLAGRVSENVAGIRDIRSTHTFQYALADFSKYLQDIFRIRLRLFEVKFLMKFVNNFLLKLTPLAFYALGGLLIINGRLTLGALVAVISAYGQLTAPWRELLRYYQRRGDAQIKYEQLVESFELTKLMEPRKLEFHPSEAVSSTPAIGTPPPLGIHGLDIADQPNSNGDAPQLLVENFNLEVAAGSAVAVVTPPGIRDQVSAILSGLVPPAAGTFQLGDNALHALPVEQRTAQISYVGTDSYVFEGTVGYNIDYALRRHPPEAGSDGYDLSEAEKTGNSRFDVAANWLPEGDEPNTVERQNFHAALLQAVGLNDELFSKAMNLKLPADTPFEMEHHLLEARKKIYADESLDGLFHKFDPQTYNPSASVAENLVFGMPIDDAFSPESLGKSQYVRQALEKAGIKTEFYRIGLQLAEKLVDFFSDEDADPALLERFRFADASTMEHLGKLNFRKFNAAPDNLSISDKELMISLTCKMVVSRHRLGLIDEQIQKSIVEARHHLQNTLPEEESRKIARFDQATINPNFSLLGNLLMGRASLTRPRAERDLLERIKKIAAGTGLGKDILLIAQNYGVGIAGQNLTQAGRQALTMARALAKRPSILVVNAGLSSIDPAARLRVRDNIVELLPDIRMIWLETDVPPSGHFSQIVTLRDIDQISSDAAETPKTKSETDMSEIDREADALAAIPLFQNVSPTNRRLMALASRRVTFAPGDAVITQGNMGDVAYVVLRGDVDIIAERGSPDERKLATVGQNELIGEISLLADVPRTATGIATTEVEALALERETFLQLMERDAALASMVAKIASERHASLIKTTAADNDEE